jgi:hypothetical protein
MTNTLSFRDRAGQFMGSTPFILAVLIICSVAMVFVGGLGYLLGLLIALITLWARRWNWTYFGLSKPQWTSSLIQALGYTLGLILFVDVLITPMVEHLTQTAHDLSSFEFLRGNLASLLIYFVFMWVVAGFGEEFFYRGYMMKRLAAIFGDTNRAWILGGLISSFTFGIVHFYQGISGVITTGLVGLAFAFIFFRNRQNLLVCMLTHGIYDMFGLTLIYFEKETVFTDWMAGVLG